MYDLARSRFAFNHPKEFADLWACGVHLLDLFDDTLVGVVHLGHVRVDPEQHILLGRGAAAAIHREQLAHCFDRVGKALARAFEGLLAHHDNDPEGLEASHALGDRDGVDNLDERSTRVEHAGRVEQLQLRRVLVFRFDDHRVDEQRLRLHAAANLGARHWRAEHGELGLHHAALLLALFWLGRSRVVEHLARQRVHDCGFARLRGTLEDHRVWHLHTELLLQLGITRVAHLQHELRLELLRTTAHEVAIFEHAESEPRLAPSWQLRCIDIGTRIQAGYFAVSRVLRASRVGSYEAHGTREAAREDEHGPKDV